MAAKASGETSTSCDTSGFTSLFGALTQGSIELASGSIRLAGRMLGDLTDEVASLTINRGKNEDKEREDGVSCAVTRTSDTLIDECVHTIDKSFERFHEALHDHDHARAERADSASK